MVIKIGRKGNLILIGEEDLDFNLIGVMDRIKYRFTHGILEYLDIPVKLGWCTTLESIILMLKKFPSFYKVCPKLKLLVDKYDEVKYKPSTKPQFKYIEFFRYIDTFDNKIVEYLQQCGMSISSVPAMIHSDMDIGFVDLSRSAGVLSCTPSDHLEDILNLKIKLNERNLPNRLEFTLFEFLKHLEYSLCYEFDQLIK